MEGPDRTKTALKTRHLTAVLISGVVFCLFAGGIPRAQEAEGRVRVDYASMQQDIRNFETVMNDAINSTFSRSPFAVVQKPKGAYLQGHGVSFSFLINIHRAVIRTPFGQVRTGPRADITPERKKQQIEQLKETLIQMLQNNGDTFRQLRKNEHVTIIAFIEDRNIPDEPSANKTIVLSALKKDLDELGHRDDRFGEFKQRIKIVEY